MHCAVCSVRIGASSWSRRQSMVYAKQIPAWSFALARRAFTSGGHRPAGHPARSPFGIEARAGEHEEVAELAQLRGSHPGALSKPRRGRLQNRLSTALA